MSDMEVIVVSHTHWDREWYMPFQEYRIWLVELMDNLLNVFEEKPNFKCFTLDGQTSILEDYLEVRPEKLEEIRRLVTEGRIIIGPWYTQPDEWLVSPESLIRNLLVGHRVGLKFGKVMKVGHVPDNFGHPSQLPQILRGFGIDSFVFQRGMGDEGEKLKTEFVWQAPDGSKVIAIHLIEGYCNAALLGIPRKGWIPFLELWEGADGSITFPRSFNRALYTFDPEIALKSIEELKRRLLPKSASGILLFMNGCDHLPAQPGITDIIEYVNKKNVGVKLIHGGLEDYINRVRPLARMGRLQTYTGEMWGARFHHLLPGVLSTRMYLKQQNRYAEILLESYAEPLASFAALLGYEYPKRLLSLAWKLLLLNHAHDSIHGSSVDPVHVEMEARYQQIRQIANGITYSALRYIANRVKNFSSNDAFRVVVYNPSSWVRNDIVRIWVDFLADEEADDYVVIDEDGVVMPIQLLKENRIEFPKPSLRCLTFIAREVPPNGYKEFAIVKAGKVKPYEKETDLNASSSSLENEFFRVEADPHRGGALTIIDKRNNFIYRDFNVFEDGGDHGDVWDYSPPKEGDVIITSKNERAKIELVENGPVTATLKISLNLNVPKKAEGDKRSGETVTLPIVSYVSLHSTIPRIDIKTIVDNTAQDHRLRVIFPTGLQTDIVNADGLFYVNKRLIKPDIKGENWVQLPPTTYPQMFWLEVDDGERGVTIANKGLPEYECKDENGATIYITLMRCVGSLGKRNLATRKELIGPPIPVPGAQCLRKHVFEYSVIPHLGDWIQAKSYQHAKNFVNPLIAWSVKGGGGELPAQDSLIKVEPDNLVVTAIKQAEDDDSTIVRFYEILGKPVTAKIQVKSEYRKAWITNLNEENMKVLEIKNGRIEVPVAAHEIITIKLASGNR